MNKSEFFQALTLWFVVVIYFHVEPSWDITYWAEGAAFFVGIGLLYLIPAYLLLVIVGRLLAD